MIDNCDDCVRALFDNPLMSQEDVDSVIYGCTLYPNFWKTNNPVKELCYQIRHARRSIARGFSITDIYEGNDNLKGSKLKKNEKCCICETKEVELFAKSDTSGLVNWVCRYCERIFEKGSDTINETINVAAMFNILEKAILKQNKTEE